jgi:hypothetical protein
LVGFPDIWSILLDESASVSAIPSHHIPWVGNCPKWQKENQKHYFSLNSNMTQNMYKTPSTLDRGIAIKT